MNAKGNQYALAALKDKRAVLSSEIIDLKRKIAARKAALEHVDATLRLLDPDADPDRIRPKRIPKHVNIFRSGELSRLLIDTLRRAGKPMATHEIVTAICEAGGHGESARRAMGQRVRANLAYQEKRKKVVKIGTRSAATWQLR